MNIGNVNIIGRERFRPPFLCRTLGHKFLETDFKIPILFLESPLYICKRCKCGKVFSIGGWSLFTPKAVERFVVDQSLSIEDRAKRLLEELAKNHKV